MEPEIQQADPLLWRGIAYALLIEGAGLFFIAVMFGFWAFAGGRL